MYVGIHMLCVKFDVSINFSMTFSICNLIEKGIVMYYGVTPTVFRLFGYNLMIICVCVVCYFVLTIVCCNYVIFTHLAGDRLSCGVGLIHSECLFLRIVMR
jgi:hypothetical protein